MPISLRAYAVCNVNDALDSAISALRVAVRRALCAYKCAFASSVNNNTDKKVA